MTLTLVSPGGTSTGWKVASAGAETLCTSARWCGGWAHGPVLRTMRRVVTSSGRQISDFGGVSLILAPPDARASRCGRAPTRYQWCPRAPAGWIWVRTDAHTRQATLDAAAIRNFTGIFVARGPQFAARPAQRAARRPRAQAACSGAWCAPARPCGPRRMRSGPGGTSRVSQYVLLPKTAGRQHRGFAGHRTTTDTRSHRNC